MMVLRALFVALVLCVSGWTQSTSPALDLPARIERQMRSQFVIQPEMKVIIGAFHPSGFPGYDAFTATFGANENKREYEFLLSADRKTMMRVFHVDLDKDPNLEIMKHISLTGRPTRGARDAKVVAVVYDDLECPFCARLHGTLFPGLLQEYGDRIQFVYKDFPLQDIHPWALHAAVDAGCLAAQSADAYWDFADYVHANQKLISGPKGSTGWNATLDRLTTAQGKKHNLDAPALQACVKAQDDTAVRASQQEGQQLGVVGTPEMFVNGRKVEGAPTIENLRASFDRALQDAGVAAPDSQSAATDKK